ncbi:hypothetical protein Tco_1345296 [Tanacetum coccineum]
MIDCLSIVETDKVIHTMETDIVKLAVEIESFGMSSDEFDKETGSSNGLQPKQADMTHCDGGRCNKHVLFALKEEMIYATEFEIQEMNTMKYDEKSEVYSCQIDEQWFDLSADLLRKALAITPDADRAYNHFLALATEASTLTPL